MNRPDDAVLLQAHGVSPLPSPVAFLAMVSIVARFSLRYVPLEFKIKDQPGGIMGKACLVLPHSMPPSISPVDMDWWFVPVCTFMIRLMKADGAREV